MAIKRPIQFDPTERPRCPLDASGLLTLSDGSSAKVRVFDLSRDGFRASSVVGIRMGGVVSMQVPGVGGIPARVLWARADKFGARFMRPVNVEACEWAREAPRDRRAGSCASERRRL